MKKLLLLSLLFTALVFQGCRKLSSDDQDLVPIAFSLAEVTKTSIVGAVPAFEALVLGSSNVADNWSVIYGASNSEGVTVAGANGKITLGGNDASLEANTTFDPPVYYPVRKSEYIYIKALAPASAIVNKDTDLDLNDNEVTFTIDGKSDITASQKIAENKDNHALSQGCGNRTNSEVLLTFDHLLSKINICIGAENDQVVSHWGQFHSVIFTSVDCRTKFVYNLTTHEISSPSVHTADGFTVHYDEKEKTLMTIPIMEGGATTASFTHEINRACRVYVYPTVFDNGAGVFPAIGGQWTVTVKTQRNNASVTETITSAITDDIGLKQGFEYDLNIIFKENKKIGFDVSIEGWVDTGSGPKVVI